MFPKAGEPNCSIAIVRSRVLKIFLFLGLSFMLTTVYVTFFQHPPPDTLLAMNRKPGSHRNFRPQRFGSPGKSSRNAKSVPEVGGERSGADTDDGEEEGADESGVKFARHWKEFLERNNYVTIGAIYDKCENWRVQYGTVVMLPDKELGGVKSRTFVNITLDKELDGGQLNVEVKYNGKDLYDNYWDLCQVDEELPPVNRTFNCPVAAGKHSKVKDKHIPNFLPKGRYQTKAWASDEEENVFACGYSDFTL